MNPDPAEIIVKTTHMKYGQSYYSNNKQLNDRIALHFYYRLASSYIKSGKVLDFGCGVGRLIKRFKNNYRTYAYDISPYGLQLVKVNSPSTTIYSDLDLLRKRHMISRFLFMFWNI